jgi:hypothetical protein
LPSGGDGCFGATLQAFGSAQVELAQGGDGVDGQEFRCNGEKKASAAALACEEALRSI